MFIEFNFQYKHSARCISPEIVVHSACVLLIIEVFLADFIKIFVETVAHSIESYLQWHIGHGFLDDTLFRMNPLLDGSDETPWWLFGNVDHFSGTKCQKCNLNFDFDFYEKHTFWCQILIDHRSSKQGSDFVRILVQRLLASTSSWPVRTPKIVHSKSLFYSNSVKMHSYSTASMMN